MTAAWRSAPDPVATGLAICWAATGPMGVVTPMSASGLQRDTEFLVVQGDPKPKS